MVNNTCGNKSQIGGDAWMSQASALFWHIHTRVVGYTLSQACLLVKSRKKFMFLPSAYPREWTLKLMPLVVLQSNHSVNFRIVFWHLGFVDSGEELPESDLT